MIPLPDRLFAAIEATWPAHARVPCGPFTLRDGQGGGKRVSAATQHAALPPDPAPALAAAESAMRAMGQAPLFSLRDDDPMDALLAARGYQRADPTRLYLGEVDQIARPPRPVSLMTCWPPLGIQRQLWTEGGIGAARLAVMARAHGPRTAFIARFQNRAAGVGFCALDGDIAMLHALHVDPAFRRQGVARVMVQGIAHWAQQQGAQWLALAVTDANAPARTLYTTLGMVEAGGYHYRGLPE